MGDTNMLALIFGKLTIVHTVVSVLFLGGLLFIILPNHWLFNSSCVCSAIQSQILTRVHVTDQTGDLQLLLRWFTTMMIVKICLLCLFAGHGIHQPPRDNNILEDIAAATMTGQF